MVDRDPAPPLLERIDNPVEVVEATFAAEATTPTILERMDWVSDPLIDCAACVARTRRGANRPSGETALDVVRRAFDCIASSRCPVLQEVVNAYGYGHPSCNLTTMRFWIASSSTVALPAFLMLLHSHDKPVMSLIASQKAFVDTAIFLFSELTRVKADVVRKIYQGYFIAAYDMRLACVPTNNGWERCNVANKIFMQFVIEHCMFMTSWQVRCIITDRHIKVHRFLLLDSADAFVTHPSLLNERDLGREHSMFFIEDVMRLREVSGHSGAGAAGRCSGTAGLAPRTILDTHFCFRATSKYRRRPAAAHRCSRGVSRQPSGRGRMRRTSASAVVSSGATTRPRARSSGR
jgi:hypothetical protein